MHKILLFALANGANGGSTAAVSVVPANGFSGSVTNNAITLQTTINGFLKGVGGALTASSTIGQGNDLPLTSAFVNWTPTISVVTPGDLNITYNQQYGTYQRIGNMGFLNFYLAATVTYTTATGIFNIVGLPGGFIPMGDEASGVMDVFVKATPIYNDGYTVYTSWMDGTGGSINIIAQSTNPAIEFGRILFIEDIDSGTSFKFRGLLTFPIYT